MCKNWQAERVDRFSTSDTHLSSFGGTVLLPCVYITGQSHETVTISIHFLFSFFGNEHYILLILPMKTAHGCNLNSNAF